MAARERNQQTYISLGSVSDNEVKLQAGSAGSRNVDLSFYTSNGGTESEAARIDSSRRLLLGTNTARSSYFNGAAAAAFQSEGTTVSNSGISVTLNAAEDTSGSGLILARSRGSAVGSHTLVGNNAPLGAVYFQGADGTDFVEGSRIQAFVDGTPGANDMPTRLVFSVTADGASSSTERLRISNNGDSYFTNKLAVNTTTIDPTAVLNVAGHIYPSVDATHDLGAPARRWNNIYTTDLKLSNEGSQNDVDGTWGNYTIQEGEEELYLINHRNGKKYKFMLQEVN